MLACLVIYIVIAPFFPPLIICRRTQFTALWLQNRNNRFPLAFLLGIRVTVAALAIIMPPLIIFNLPVFVAVLLAVPFSLWASRSRWLLSQYLYIAAKFLVNLNEKRLENEGDRGENWIDKQIKVGCFYCSAANAACGKTMTEMDWGRKLHINVIKIQRGKKYINIPPGKEVLHEGDRLYVSGGYDAITNFILYVRQNNLLEADECNLISLHDFIEAQDEAQPNILVTALRLEKNSVLVNKSIKEANIRNIWSCFVIGVEREKYPFIDPNPNMILRVNDTLWILGTQKMAATLIKQGLL